MKILLVNPQTDVFEMRANYEAHENLALGLLAAHLSAHDHATEIIDLRVDDFSEQEVARHVQQHAVGLVGLSVNFVTLPSALRLARAIRQARPATLIVLGGEHASYQDDTLLAAYPASIDAVIRGEGEASFAELAQALDDGRDWRQTSGLSYLDAHTRRCVRTASRPAIEQLDALPFADRAVARRAIAKHRKIEIGILAQRGCPFPCSFCNANRFLSNEAITAVRQRSAEHVVAEMVELAPLIAENRSFLRFYDATFVTQSRRNRAWIDDFCTALEQRKLRIPFDVFVRANSFDLNKPGDQALITRLKSVGMISTYIGLESGSDDTLALYNKHVNASDSEKMFEYFRSQHIQGSTNGCMTFQQDSTLADIAQTVRFLRRLGLCSLWNCLSRAETLPGIKLEMRTHKRETCWDVYNYQFTDSRVARLYAVLYSIHANHSSIKLEDGLVRALRDRLRIESFYAPHAMDWLGLEHALEARIGAMQAVTSEFVLGLIDQLPGWNETMLEHAIHQYLGALDQALDALHASYGWLLTLPISAVTTRPHHANCVH